MDKQLEELNFNVNMKLNKISMSLTGDRETNTHGNVRMIDGGLED
jgi:hypothetical protein